MVYILYNRNSKFLNNNFLKTTKNYWFVVFALGVYNAQSTGGFFDVRTCSAVSKHVGAFSSVNQTTASWRALTGHASAVSPPPLHRRRFFNLGGGFDILRAIYSTRMEKVCRYWKKHQPPKPKPPLRWQQESMAQQLRQMVPRQQRGRRVNGWKMRKLNQYLRS